MGFAARHALQEKDLRNLELIFETNGNLQVLRMNPEWSDILEHQAKLKEAVGSIGVEGTILSLEQARAITTEEHVEVGEKEKREFVGYYESLEYVRQHLEDELSMSLLLKIHEKVTVGDPAAHPGHVREDSRGVSYEGHLIYTAPPPGQLSFLLREFLTWFNNATREETTSPIVAAGICHFWFVWVHPFRDGNGRVARLLTTFLLLKRNSEGIRYFALSDYYNEHRKEYYEALARTNQCDPGSPAMNFAGDLTPWLSFFIKSYLAQMGEIREITNRILQLNIRVAHLRKNGLISEKHEKALSFLSSRERAFYRELAQALGSVTKQRIHQILAPLREAHVLLEEKIGKEMWFRLGSPSVEPDESVFKQMLKRKSVDKFRRAGKKPQGQAVLPIFDLGR